MNRTEIRDLAEKARTDLNVARGAFRKLALANGYKGQAGGWIYHEKHSFAIVQGWQGLADLVSHNPGMFAVTLEREEQDQRAAEAETQLEEADVVAEATAEDRARTAVANGTARKATLTLTTPAPKVKPLSRAMQRAKDILDRDGYVDTIDGVTVGTIVALMDRGILREVTPLRHGLSAGRNYPATTPEQVWDEAHAEHEQCGCLRNPIGHSRAEHPTDDAADAMEGDDTPEPLTAESADALAARAGFGPVPEGPYGALAAFADDVAARPGPRTMALRQRQCVRTDGSHVNHAEPVDGMNCDPDRPTPEDERVTKAQREAFGSPIPAAKRKPGTVHAGSPSRFRDEASVSAPTFPEGTPEHAAYAAELREELSKFARGETPYPYEGDGNCSKCGRPNPPQGCAINCGARMDDAMQTSAPAPTLADDVAALRTLIETEMGDFAAARGAGLELLDRIAARAPQRATFEDGRPIWQHACGAVKYSKQRPPFGGCSWCYKPGAWQALYTLPGGTA